MKFILCTASLLFFSAFAVPAQQVAFTFDDLPAHGEVPPGQTRLQIAQSILKTIHDQRLPPTYGFVNAHHLEEKPAEREVLEAWRTAGQPLGNHGYSHLSMNDHTVEEYTADIAKNEPVLTSLMPHQDWHWFRYPFLWEGETLEKRRAVRTYLQQNHYQVAQVSMDFEDYLWNAPYARCVAKQDDTAIASLRASYLATADQFIALFRTMSHTLYGRDIPYVLLLHIGAFDAQMFPQLIELFRQRGFTFISMTDALKDPVFKEDPNTALKYGGAFQEQWFAAKHLKVPPGTKPYKELEAVCR
ncbi:polysaccharide deacetylase family protein [soil metagenome]